MTQMEEYRNQIDRIDRELVRLWEERMEVAQAIGLCKRDSGMKVLDPERERAVLERIQSLVRDPALRGDVVTLYETILALSRQRQHCLLTGEDPWVRRYLEQAALARNPVEHPRVLYQGEPGAYTEEAVLQFFGENPPRTPVAHWTQMMEGLTRGEADYGVLPIENGATGPVYDLLARWGAYIVGEQFVRCGEFSAEAIQFNRDNCTRFVVVAPVMERRPGGNKLSALVTVPHKRDALHQIISVFAVAGLSLMKVESRPAPGQNGGYLFYLDFSGDLTRPGMDAVLRELSLSAVGFRVLGNYKAAPEGE